MSDQVGLDFIFSYDAKEEFPLIVSGNPTIIRVNTFALNSGWYVQRAADFPAQTARLLSNFTNYQQYTVKSVRLTWMPRYSHPVDRFVQDVGLSSDGPTRIMNTIVNSKFTVLCDKDDASTGTNNLDSYFQVRDVPNAMNFSYTEPWSFVFRPTVFDVIAQSAIVGTENASATGATLAPLNLSAPVDFKWFATRAVDNNTAGNTALNTSIQTLGVKIFHYTPFNVDNADYKLDIGRYRVDVRFSFRYPEYRSPFSISLGSVIPNGTTNNLLAMQEEEALNTLLGEARKIRPLSETVVPISDLGKADAISESLSGSNLQSDAGERAIKRMRTRYSEDLQTQSDHPVLGAPVEDGPMQT